MLSCIKFKRTFVVAFTGKFFEKRTELKFSKQGSGESNAASVNFLKSLLICFYTFYRKFFTILSRRISLRTCIISLRLLNILFLLCKHIYIYMKTYTLILRTYTSTEHNLLVINYFLLSLNATKSGMPPNIRWCLLFNIIKTIIQLGDRYMLCYLSSIHI